MSLLDKIPVFVRKTIFEKVFSIAEYSNMTKEEKTMYNGALKRKWDNQNVLDYAVKTAKEEGIEEGIKKGIEKGIEQGIEKGIEQGTNEERAKAEAEKRGIALELKRMGMPVADIARAVRLSEEEIERL